MKKIKIFLVQTFIGIIVFSYIFLKKYLTFYFWNPLFAQHNIPNSYSSSRMHRSIRHTVYFGDEISFAIAFLFIGTGINILLYNFLKKDRGASKKICYTIQLIIVVVALIKLYTSKFFLLF
ncbi:hypothetical protein [Enterococcus sp. AZ196]|uniref:hypothetical protein n=1 Tax=Enterococcus sp. AZ196 TaxID=2774659 RepID=UPI003D2D5355